MPNPLTLTQVVVGEPIIYLIRHLHRLCSIAKQNWHIITTHGENRLRVIYRSKIAIVTIEVLQVTISLDDLLSILSCHLPILHIEIYTTEEHLHGYRVCTIGTLATDTSGGSQFLLCCQEVFHDQVVTLLHGISGELHVHYLLAGLHWYTQCCSCRTLLVWLTIHIGEPEVIPATQEVSLSLHIVDTGYLVICTLWHILHTRQHVVGYIDVLIHLSPCIIFCIVGGEKFIDTYTRLPSEITELIVVNTISRKTTSCC